MRKNKQGGFTLIEMLIVVAIIAILVAVSIPLVGNSLEKARIATDAANERAAKAEIIIKYLNEDTDLVYDASGDAAMLYDASDGTLKDANNPGGITGYGKCTQHRDGIVRVTINKTTGTVGVSWMNTSGSYMPDAHNGQVVVS